MIQAKLKSFRELKAEKANRLETWRLQLRLRLMDKESGHQTHLSYVERKALVRQMESVRRTTGYSPLSVPPKPADRALRDSPYFSSSRRVSERALRKWRLQEALLERELRLSDLELHKRQAQQAALVRLLVDLGVIDESSQVETLGQASPHEEELPPQQQQQQQQQQLLQQPQQKPRFQRPFTANPAVTTQLPPLLEKSTSQSPVSALQRAASAEKPQLHVAAQAAQRRGVRFSIGGADTGDEPDGQPDAGGLQAMTSKLPQWKRQLRYEAPPALGAQRESARVRLAVSKSALRRELQQMVDAHEKDPVKIAQAEVARREQSRLAMQQTVSHMRRMSLLPPEGHDPARRGSVSALLQLDRDSSSGEDEDDRVGWGGAED